MGAQEYELNEEIEIKIPLRKELRESLRRLTTPNQLKSSLSIAIDWAIIFLGYFLIFKSYFLLPIGILLIGSRQRAISNLSHDASHVNLFKKKSINDFISNIFCALPMFETVEAYRKSHNQHHQHLGDLVKDPDSSAHLGYGYNDSDPWKGNPVLNFFRLLINRKALKASFLGSLVSLSKIEKFVLLTFWISILLLGSVFTTFEISLISVLCWFLAKLTTYHMIRIFAEFLDHSGLENKDVISFTRNLPHTGVLRLIFHPNCDTYHIVHHLYPKIPHYNLAQADKILSARLDYMIAHHCDSYFFGNHSAVDCWVGNCRGSYK